MKRILAVAKQTSLGAFRFKAVFVVALLLLLSVLILPFIIQHNGTAKMFAQVMLTYNLTVITGLIGFTTLWMACGSLSGEIDAGQLQMVVVKPIARWQIFLGKWIGINFISGLLLVVASGSVLGLLYWKARQLEPTQQEILHKEVLVSRGSLQEALPDLDRDVTAVMQQRIEQANGQSFDVEAVEESVRVKLLANHQTVAPNYRRIWDLELGPRRVFLKDKPMSLQVKFFAASVSDEQPINTVWVIHDKQTGLQHRFEKQFSSGVLNEFEIPANCYSKEGTLTVECENRDRTTILFPLDDGLTLMYPEGGFLMNYFRGLVIIFCWMALLAAVGLAASSILSFSVATLLSLTILLVGVSSGTFAEAIQDDTVWGIDEDSGERESPILDQLFLPVFKAVSFVVTPVNAYAPITLVASGRAVRWESTAMALVQIIVLGAGLFGALGAYLFSRRQLGSQMSTR